MDERRHGMTTPLLDDDLYSFYDILRRYLDGFKDSDLKRLDEERDLRWERRIAYITINDTGSGREIVTERVLRVTLTMEPDHMVCKWCNKDLGTAHTDQCSNGSGLITEEERTA